MDQLYKRIDFLVSKGDSELAGSLEELRYLLEFAEGRSLAEILRTNP
jgi:hypothetical protein